MPIKARFPTPGGQSLNHPLDTTELSESCPFTFPALEVNYPAAQLRGNSHCI